jgi:hypothetical protein
MPRGSEATKYVHKDYEILLYFPFVWGGGADGVGTKVNSLFSCLQMHTQPHVRKTDAAVTGEFSDTERFVFCTEFALT